MKNQLEDWRFLGFGDPPQRDFPIYRNVKDGLIIRLFPEYKPETDRVSSGENAEKTREQACKCKT